MRSILGFCVALPLLPVAAQPASDTGKAEPESAIKAEVKGRLARNFTPPGQLAVTAGGAAIQLDWSRAEAIKKRAEGLVEKTVVVNGRMEFRRLPEEIPESTGRGWPRLAQHPRPVLIVESIAEAK